MLGCGVGTRVGIINGLWHARKASHPRLALAVRAEVVKSTHSIRTCCLYMVFTSLNSESLLLRAEVVCHPVLLDI